MRRDYFDATVRNVDEHPGQESDGDRPVIEISFDGPDGLLAERLVTEDGPLAASDVDVTYRRTAADSDGASGVLSLANRLTGEFVLETNVAPDDVHSLVESVKQADGDDGGRYRVRLVDADGDPSAYDKETLLVYDADGSLLRQRSLIPGGVEL